MKVKLNKIICGDCIDVMSDIPDESIDLIYTDPPFYSGRKHIGKAGSFNDKWTTFEKYLNFMETRLVQMYRVLKPSGSFYLHCDPTASHYLKIILDSIFGMNYFHREIVWSPGTVSGYKSRVNGWVRGHDTILYYTKSSKFTFNKSYRQHKKEYIARFKKSDSDGRLYRDDRSGGRRQYLDETKGSLYSDVWSDIMSFQQASNSTEYLDYPTQKPGLLLSRIIKSSSNKGDLILDPFCGSGTTCKVAKMLGREYLGIDVSKNACDIAKNRLIT